MKKSSDLANAKNSSNIQQVRSAQSKSYRKTTKQITKRTVLPDGTIVVTKIKTFEAQRPRKASHDRRDQSITSGILPKNAIAPEIIHRSATPDGSGSPQKSKKLRASPEMDLSSNSPLTPAQIESVCEKADDKTKEKCELGLDALEDDAPLPPLAQIETSCNEVGVKIKDKCKGGPETLEAEDAPMPPEYSAVDSKKILANKNLTNLIQESEHSPNEGQELQHFNERNRVMSILQRQLPRMTRASHTVMIEPELLASTNPSPNSQQYDLEVEATLVQDTARSLRESNREAYERTPICDAVLVSDTPTNSTLTDFSRTQSWLKWSVGVLVLIGLLVAIIAVLAVQKNNPLTEEEDYGGDVSTREHTNITPTLLATTIPTPQTAISSLSPLVPTSPPPRTNVSSKGQGNVSSKGQGNVSSKGQGATKVTTNNSCARFKMSLFENACAMDCYPVMSLDGDTAVVSRWYESIQFYLLVDEEFVVVTTIDIDYGIFDIAISGNVAVVGSPKEDGDTGAVHVFEKNPLGIWEETARITPEDIVGTQASFGRAVSIHNDVMVVGAPFEWDESSDEGYSYVYRRTDSRWNLEAKLEADGSLSYLFGKAVSVRGDTVAVGSNNAALIFKHTFPNNWGHFGGPLINYNCAGGFGESLDLENNGTVLIGCTETNVDSSGSVYYYEQSGDEFDFQQKIKASDISSGEYFGGVKQVSADGNLMVVGTYVEKNGKFYVFKRLVNEWVEVALVEAPDGSGNYFGDFVALSGNSILVYSNTNVFLYSVEDC